MSEFTTARLTLRPWKPTEAERLLDIRSRPAVAQWLGDPTPWTETSTARDAIARWAERADADKPLGIWAIVPPTGPIAGTVSFTRLPEDTELEIGWYLHPDSTGHGYASEAAAAVLDQAASHGVERVWAVMWPDNEPSARVAKAIGMDDLGVRKDRWYGSVEDPDSQMFRIDLTAEA